MSTIEQTADPQTDPSPLAWATPIDLQEDSKLHIADVREPLTANQRWRVVVTGHLYLIAGWDQALHLRAGYLGQSSAVAPGRSYDSMTHWTIAQRAFAARRIGLVRFAETPSGDFLRLAESRVIMSLSAAGLYLLNTHTSAGKAGSRLSRAERLQALGYAATLTEALQMHVLSGRTNPRLTPAANSREAAVRVIRSAQRALDTRELYQALRRQGWVTAGRTPEFSLRRDLNIRERETPGTPRVFTAMHRCRRVYWNPEVSKSLSLERYDLAHPLPR